MCNNIRQRNDFVQCDARSIFAVQENKKTYRLLNEERREICQVRIDGGLIQEDNIKRCDYGFWICEANLVFLVELKGKNIKKAIEQLISTINVLRNELQGRKINARVVLSKVPNVRITNSPAYYELKRALNGGDFRHKCRTLEDRIIPD